MRVLMLAQHANFFRNLDTVLRELCARGHEVVFLHGTRLDDPVVGPKVERKRKRLPYIARGIQAAESEMTGVRSGYRPDPPEAWQRLLAMGRQVINRGMYFRPNHPSPDRVVDALETKLPEWLVARITVNPWRWLLGRKIALRFWRWLEAASPASPTLVSMLRDLTPDVVLVVPTVWPKHPVESDYFRAAHELKIPTVGYVNSWDNLTSKGTVHVLPDVYVVWNELLAREASEIHDIPVASIRIAGAPHVDRFFGRLPSQDASSIRRVMGCPPDRAYVVYLCSSRTLIASEVELVEHIADALGRRLGTEAPVVVVRPHPTNPGPWSGFAHDGVAVHPRQGDLADSPASWQEYFDQLAHAACVFGLNTTAFMESVVADRPCLTLVADEYWPAQGRTGHFRHLLTGDFLEVAATVDDIAARVARILEGADEKAESRRVFVRSFLRPCGADTPAAAIVADILERSAAASTRSGSEARGSLVPVPGLGLRSGGIQA